MGSATYDIQVDETAMGGTVTKIQGISGTSYNLINRFKELKIENGTYIFYIEANDTDTTSGDITFRYVSPEAKLSEPQNLRWDGTVAKWDSVAKAIKDEEQHIVELANLSIKSPNNRDNYEAAISDCTDRIKVLLERREEILKQLNFNEAAKAEIERIERYLTEDRAVVTEFDDCTVRRLVNSISISKDMELTLYLKGGYEVKGKYLPLKNTA